jgi:hypothetical protein
MSTSSGTNVFEKSFFIDDIIEESYERIGLINNTGNQIKAARRSLNILFQEWANRGLHYWEVANNSISLVEDQSVYTLFRASSDGTSDGVFTLLNGAITSSSSTITVDSVSQFPATGTLLIGSEKITYTTLNSSANTITGLTRGANSTTAAAHADNAEVFDNNSIVYGTGDILEAVYRDTQQSPVVDFPLTKIDRSAYSGLSSKFSTGTPTQYFVERFIDKITITLFLTPGADQVNNVINYYYEKRIEDVGAYTNITNVPYRFVPCMCAGLTYYLAQKYTPQRVQEMKLLYEDELKRALDQDGSSTSSFITPKVYYPGA